MFKKLAVSFVAAGMAIAASAAGGGASHRVTLFEPSEVNGQVLKPGDYKLEINGGKAILSRGKEKVEATVSVEQAGSKFNTTSVRYASGGGKYAVQEIRVGGTNTKVVFGDPAPGAAAAGGGR